MLKRIALIILASSVAVPIFTFANDDDALLENMEKSVSANKSVSRSEWLEGIDTLADSLEKSNAASSSDGANANVYFDGISNNITSGTEHKFIEKRLLEKLRKKNIPYTVQNPSSPFPPDTNDCILKGSIENTSIIIGKEKTNAYTLKLQLLKNDSMIWTDSVMLVPQSVVNTIESAPTQTSTQVIVSGAIMKPNFRPMRPACGFSTRPVVVINGNGVTIIPTGRYRMHPFSPRPSPIIILPKPQSPRPQPVPPPRPQPPVRPTPPPPHCIASR